MRRIMNMLGVLILVQSTPPLSSAADRESQPAWPTAGWSVAEPQSVGLLTEPLDQLVADARSGRFRDLHSLLVVKDGQLVLEEYLPGGAKDQLHTLQSVSKSVAATLVGIALQKELITGTDAPLLGFFPQYEDIDHLDERKQAITLEHVLRMRLGMAWREQELPYGDPQNSLRRLNDSDGDWYKLVLDTPMKDAPGEQRLYNSGGAILLAGVLDHATGQRTDAFAREHLFEPLGIRSVDWTVVRGVTHTGGGLSMSSRDMAKIGYLYLTDGVWDGRRLLPEGWVARATTGRIASPQPGVMPLGYGYMWWLLPGLSDLEREEADAEIYAAWGHMGQFIFVAPEYDLVFVTTGGATDIGDETMPFDLLYEYILPAADPTAPFDPQILEVASAGEKSELDGEEPTIPTFETTFGGVNADRGIDVTPTADGGYAVVGTTTSFGAGDEDVYLIRTDGNGESLFTKAIGGARRDCGWSIRELDDAGFAIAGFTESSGAGGVDGYLIRTNAEGDTLWTRTYGGTEDDIIWSLLPLDDGGFVLGGETASAGAGELDCYLIRTDADGRILWEQTYGGPQVDRAFSVIQTEDGGFVLAGITYSFGAGGRDGYVVKTDASGEEVWSRPFGSEGYDVIHSVCATAEPGCVVVGYTAGLSVHGGQDGWVLKLDPNGETEWTSIFGGARDDRILNGAQTPDGGYVLGGFTASTDAAGLDVYLAKLDAGGAFEWSRTIGGRGEDSGYGITCTLDGGVIVTGLTKSTGAGEADVYLIKTDGRGVR